jgi:lactate permease
MKAVLAASPIVLVVMLMTWRGWSAVRAGSVTAVATLMLGLGVFGRGDTANGRALLGIAAEASFITATIIGIIGPALGLHLLQRHSGATDRLQSLLASLHPDPRIGALAVAWFFTLFLEGAAGFGTPVALAAPLLVSAGYTPATAVVAALAGHGAGVSFGAVGTPVLAQSTLVDIPALDLARSTVVFHLVVGWLLLAAVVMLLRQGRSGLWGWGIAGGFAFFVPFGLIAATMGPELATLGGVTVGVAAWGLMLRWRRSAPSGAPHHDLAAPSTARAMAPYLWLIVAVAVTRLVSPVRSLTEEVELVWQFDGFRGRVQPLTHPAVLLTVAFVVAAVAQRVQVPAVLARIRRATLTMVPVAVAVLAMVTIARTMTQTGMTTELAAAAVGVGAAWPIVAPAVGALGTFVTGSATASNLLFSELQFDAATRLRFPPPTVLGAQGFGAAIGNIICPHNIVAAAATVGAQRQEGQILRRTVPLAAAALTVGGAMSGVLTLVM